MPRGAAFFDLDRTLLRGASGPLITQALVAAGIVPERSVPGQGLLYRVFDVVGETLPSMALARGAARLAKGWSAEAVRKAGMQAADDLVELVAPYAVPLIDEHRSAGRPVVLATTTPDDLVRPLAERLGLDDVVATRYAEADGAYTGRLDGEFVWAAGKRRAVARWADDHDVDLSASWAYSDSVYDAPLLGAVGHPTAVNPDPRLRALAAVRRWPVLSLHSPPGVPTLFGLEAFDLTRALARPELIPYARFRFQGLEHIPRTGGVIVVANHRSYYDPMVLGMVLLRTGRKPRFLGKKEVFDAPIVGQLAKATGQIRVDRGSGSAAPLDAAARALAAGESVVILPQGTIPRGVEFYEPVLKGRTGAARLAARTGAPVVPIGLWGTEAVWPRSARVPNVTNVTSPPEVRVRVGSPIALGLDDPAADTKAIMKAIVALLPPEARRRHRPTAEEIARATPANAKKAAPPG